MIHTAEQQLQDGAPVRGDAAADLIPAVCATAVGVASDRIRQRTCKVLQRAA